MAELEREAALILQGPLSKHCPAHFKREHLIGETIPQPPPASRSQRSSLGARLLGCSCPRWT